MTTVRVLAIAADPLVRSGLAALLADQAPVEVVGFAAPGDDLTAAIEAFQPQVLLWDLGWDAGATPLNLETASTLDVPVLVLAPTEFDILSVWQAGARGVMDRAALAPTLVAGLVAVAAGLAVFEPVEEGAGNALPPLLRPPPTAEPALVESLTTREMDVLRGMADGLSNKLIARSLGISEHTVKFHVNAILGKLGAQSRTDAVVRASRAGVLLL